jgi:hypothetical protein
VPWFCRIAVLLVRGGWGKCETSVGVAVSGLGALLNRDQQNITLDCCPLENGIPLGMHACACVCVCMCESACAYKTFSHIIYYYLPRCERL